MYSEERLLEFIRTRPHDCRSVNALARYSGISDTTWRKHIKENPRIHAAVVEIYGPSARQALNEAQAQAIEDGVLPVGRTPTVPTAEGLKRLRALAAQQPSLKFIARELGFDPTVLKDWIEQYPEAQAAIEAGRGDVIKLVAKGQIRRALDGDTRAAEFLTKVFDPSLLQKGNETLHRHEFTFALPQLAAPATPDPSIIDLTAEEVTDVSPAAD